VTGVSWYEAAAFAEYVGKSLPTSDQWDRARGAGTPVIDFPQLGGFALFAPFSNFSGERPIAVGSMSGITAFGAYDMAGNAREWVYNEARVGRTIRGGGFGDQTYMFKESSQAPEWDRSEKNGFRCAFFPSVAPVPETAFQRIDSGARNNFAGARPVADPVFEIYRQRFDYDLTPTNGRVESTDDTSPYWTVERVTYDAAYGGERITAHLFLPKNTQPPFQTVVYFPGSGALFYPTSEGIADYFEVPVFLSFLPRSGRAVLFPVYEGTFERKIPDLMSMYLILQEQGRSSHRHTEWTEHLVKDFRRGLDYLETRKDIDSDRLAYYGMSWGALQGTIITAVEPRLAASVLLAGGLSDTGRPEVAPINFVSRVTLPTLLLNGQHDAFFPHDTAVKPQFDLLGTPDADKKLVLFDSDHIVPRDGFIRETLAWLDTYLGPVQQHTPDAQ
jgi:dienelactone hydrolase